MNTELLWFTAPVLSFVFLLGWVWQLRTKNAGIVDVVWSFSVGVCGFYYFLMVSGDLWVKTLGALICGIWFFRLGSFLLTRVLGEAEDGRYIAMRAAMGHRANLYHFFFFQFQALLAWLFSLPMWMAAQSAQSDPWQLVLVGMIALIAGAGEHLADTQLSRFRAIPANKGKTCRDGLWRYSRHPNYFFEWVHWFCYPLLGIYSIYSGYLWLVPIAMLLFLYYITGIPFSEQQALRSRGDDYRDYQRTTSAFIPWRPKNGNSVEFS